MTTVTEVSTREAYGKALVELGKEYQDIVVLDADLSRSTMTKYFAAKFPERFFQCGLQEQNMVGIAAGLAASGKIPFVSTFAVFAACRCLDQVRVCVAQPKLNVKIVATHGGITVGEDGASHQSIEDIALMRVLPNMVVIVPADAHETKQVVHAISDYYGPTYVRLGRSNVPIVMPDEYIFKIGRAYSFHIGREANIIAAGIMVSVALDAARILNLNKIDTGVINMSTIKPLDAKTLLKVAKSCRLVVTAEEHSVIGGLGSAVTEYLSEKYPVNIKRIGIKDDFGCSGTPEGLLKLHGLTSQNIVKTIRKAYSID